MTKKLYDYQEVGVKFLIGTKRAMLCDSMGLGKTAQALSALQKLYANTAITKAIVICPNSVKMQWKTETKEFTTLMPEVIEAKKKRHLKYEEEMTGKVIIMNYELFIRDFRMLQIDYETALIVDEASKLKNYKTNINKIVSAVSRRVRYFWLLTGTPIENSLQNFFVLANLVKPFFMSWQQFLDNYCNTDAINLGSKTVYKITSYRNLDQFTQKISSISLRRNKVAVDLPPLTINYEFFSSTKTQKKCAEDIREVICNADSKTDVFSTLTLLRVIDDSPELLKCSISPLAKKVYRQSKEPCSKLERLKEILQETDAQKVLVFTQFAKMAEAIHIEIPDSVLCQGKTQDKTLVIDYFKTSSVQVMISTDVLSYGMNLQNVDLLINFDLPYNPAVLNQRIGRIHRIGAKNSKQVINFVGDEIEKDIYFILKKKTDLFEQVVNGRAIENIDLRKELLEKIIAR